MRESHTNREPASLSGCMPYTYAGSQQAPLPVQRFSTSEMQSNAGNQTYLPFERQLHTSQHPCASRLRPSARLGASTNHTLPVNNTSVRISSAAQDHTETTFEPLSYPSHSSSGRHTSQGAGFGISAALQTNAYIPAHCHSSHQHHIYPSNQHQESVQPHMTCEESWPWDDLLDSPGSDSYQSASTTYDPPSVDSIPDSYDSSTGLDTALLAQQPWNHSSSDTHQAATQAENAIQGPAPALPPLAPKGICPSAAAYCRLGPLSELRRVPRPRFRLANQRPTAARRSLLADFDAVEDFSDDGGLHLDADCSFNVSSLIKAHVQPGYHQQQQQQLQQWGLQKTGGHGSYQDEMLMLVSHPVSISDLEWQDPNASTDVVLAMGGMSIKKASQHSREHGLKSKSQGTQSAESGNADSMFAWLSKLLPGL